MIYFDSAATSYYRPSCVKEAVAEAIDTFGNPSRGAYGASLKADRCLLETRIRLSELFHADGPDCVSFTMNATQALNTAILGQDLGAEDHLIVSLQEHNSVLRPAYLLRKKGVQVHFAALKADGRFDIDSFQAILASIREKDRSCRIVTALSHGSNVTGCVIPIEKVRDLCREYGSFLIVDAAQTAGLIPIDMKEDGIDILCFSGHKALMGPQGTGALIVRRGIRLRPLMTGGSGIRTFLETMPEEMPEHLEAGTQNAHSTAGLLAALKWADGKRSAWHTQEMELTERFLDGIRRINKTKERCSVTPGAAGAGSGSFEPVHVYGRSDSFDRNSLPTAAFNVGSLEAGVVADRLWRDREIAVRAGGHCAPLIHRFFGTEKRGIVRVSFSHFNTKQQVDVLLKELGEIAAETEGT